MKTLFILILCVSLYGDKYLQKFEGKFEGWSEKRLELISLFLPPNPTIVQAGGHYGKETIEIAYQWPMGTIISFEPNPHAFAILSGQTASFKQISVHPLALSDKVGIFPFYVCYGTYGKSAMFEHASSLLKPSANMEIHYQGPVIDVECIRLQDWCKTNGVDQIDFLRLDLQGYELQVLKNSSEILKSVSCIYVQTYFYPFRIGTTQFSDLRKQLEESGFQLLGHWYREGLEGSAIFIRSDFFGIPFEEKFDARKYSIYYSPGASAYFYIDDVPDSIKMILREGIAWEGNQSLLMGELIPPGSTVIDIGAHIGVHTVMMSRKVGPEGAVIAFEPQKKIYLEQVENLKINRCTNVVSICKALGDSFKTVQMAARDPTNEGGTAIGEGGDIVEMIPLDSLQLNNVSLIKIDVENYEYFTLLGAKDTILRNKPIIVFEMWIGSNFEASPDYQKENFDRVCSLLESYGYDIYVIYGNDFIAYPFDSDKDKFNLHRLDKNAFDLGF